MAMESFMDRPAPPPELLSLKELPMLTSTLESWAQLVDPVSCKP